MQRGCQRLWQHLAVLLAWPLGPFWLLFAFGVAIFSPVDSDFTPAASLEWVAAAGVGMAFISVVSMLWSAGLFGRSAGNWGCASILLAGLALASLGLYLAVGSLALTWVALPAYGVGVAVVLLGRAGLRNPETGQDKGGQEKGDGSI